MADVDMAKTCSEIADNEEDIFAPDEDDEFENAVFMMRKYIEGDLAEYMIPAFDRVYHDYILWPAVFFDKPILSLPQPRRHHEDVWDAFRRDPSFWKDYCAQTQEILQLKPCPVKLPRVYLSDTVHLAETPCGFYYKRLKSTFGIWFVPHRHTSIVKDMYSTLIEDQNKEIEIEIEIEEEEETDTSDLVHRFDGEFERSSSAKDPATLLPRPKYETEEVATLGTGTYNLVYRSDGKFERLRPAKTD